MLYLHSQRNINALIIIKTSSNNRSFFSIKNEGRSIKILKPNKKSVRIESKYLDALWFYHNLLLLYCKLPMFYMKAKLCIIYEASLQKSDASLHRRDRSSFRMMHCCVTTIDHGEAMMHAS